MRYRVHDVCTWRFVVYIEGMYTAVRSGMFLFYERLALVGEAIASAAVWDEGGRWG